MWYHYEKNISPPTLNLQPTSISVANIKHYFKKGLKKLLAMLQRLIASPKNTLDRHQKTYFVLG